MLFRFLAFLAVLVCVVGHEFSECGVGRVSKLGLIPDPPVVGANLTVLMETQVTGTQVPVSSGSVNFIVSAYGIVITTKTFDLCAATHCPLAPPHALATLTYLIPSAAPAGVEIEATIQIKDSTDKELACSKIKVTMRGGYDTPKHESDMVARALQVSSEAWMQLLFQAWVLQFSVDFGSEHDAALSFETFKTNHAIISNHNRASSAHSWRMGHNRFSHMNHTQFVNAVQLKPMPPTLRDTTLERAMSAIPATVDWVAAGAVTAVKNQGQCGACWAFATTGALEGAIFIKTKQLISLSEQMVLDCDTKDSGCGGGSMDSAFAWISGNRGLCAEQAYPYLAVQSSACHKNCTIIPGSAPTTYTDVAATEDALAVAIAKQPVAVAIEADQSGFQFYSSGVFTGACGTTLDHGVLAVGYGPKTVAEPAYWKVKNSWGASWGDAGFIRIERGGTSSSAGGLCGILLAASFPTL